jgi:hypothetical protein
MDDDERAHAAGFWHALIRLASRAAGYAKPTAR